MPYTEMGTCVPLDQTTTASRCRHARECDPREEPYALARTYGSVRGARGNPGPYRDDQVGEGVRQDTGVAPG